MKYFIVLQPGIYLKLNDNGMPTVTASELDKALFDDRRDAVKAVGVIRNYGHYPKARMHQTTKGGKTPGRES